MPDLTKRQHNVPAFYLRLWRQNSSSSITCHDLVEERTFPASPDNIMVRQFFYEKNQSRPDNRIENLLGKMETECSVTFNQLGNLDLSITRSSDKNPCINRVKGVLSSDGCKAIKKFAAYQYCRVPGAIEQKRYELQSTTMSQRSKEIALNPGSFVKSGYEYVKERFQVLKMLVFISAGQDFITSDWPCFDLKDHGFSPLLGEEVGNNPEIVVYMPVTPRICLILFHADFSITTKGQTVPRLIVKSCSDSVVRNQNTLLIQQAERFVVASNPSPFIYKVAKKRKKSNSINL